MICGACRQQHETATEVRSCYQRRYKFGEEYRRNRKPHAEEALTTSQSRASGTLTPSLSESRNSSGGSPSEEEVDAEYIQLVRQQEVEFQIRLRRLETAREQGEVPLSNPVPAGSRPFRHCPECDMDVLSCPHLPDYWCQECRKFTNRPGIHQNCGPGRWK